VDAGLFDVLHHAADQHALAIGQAVDVDFNRIIEEMVEQHRGVVADLHGLAHVTLEVARFVTMSIARPPST